MNIDFNKAEFSFINKQTNDPASPMISGTKYKYFHAFVFSFFLFGFIYVIAVLPGYSQMYPQNNYQQPYQTNYMAGSTAFKQEIARLEINVARPGKVPISITQVPRLEKDDLLKVRLLDEAVNGMKPDQSNFDWTFLVAFINPGRNNDSEKTLSEEINFRKKGWYKEYTFVVPYDSQPIFFIYPKPQYRSKILNLISKNQDEIRKIGEKTIEIADAYAKIGTFLNELQTVVNRNYYGGYYNNGYGMYGNYGNYGPYGNYGQNTGFNQTFLMEQTVERLAKSFNIQLPTCWGGNTPYGNNPYNNVYGGYQNGMMFNDFMGRVQCVARSVRIEDFDLSVSRMLQQGGVFAAAQLTQRYPQLAFWINIAAAALDFILKITNKTPLKIVPTVISTTETPAQNAMYQNNMAAASSVRPADSVKISLFAESQPMDKGFVTAYPLVVNKWQANADPEVISLPVPALTESCLHPGQNVLRSADLLTDWMADNFTKDFQLVISSSNGFRKTFPLKKNIGLSGWELNVTKDELNTIPKINMTLEAVITGKRGFNEIQSPKFPLPLMAGGEWTIDPQSQRAFMSGGKRIITLKNQFGNCRCLQSVVYRPAFGGPFIFAANSKENGLIFSPDLKEVSFEVDATNFPGGPGQLELVQFGGETINLSLNLYPPPPNITNLKIAKGDNQAIIIGERLDQIQAVKINGKRAIIKESKTSDIQYMRPANNQNGYLPGAQNGQGMYPASNQGNMPNSGILTEKTVVFEDPGTRQDTNKITLELELDGSRNYTCPGMFTLSASRPSIVADESKEIEGAFRINSVPAEKMGVSRPQSEKAAVISNKPNLSINLGSLPVFPIESSEITVNIQNALTDYDFKIENIQVETRVENSQINPSELPVAGVQVWDWRSMQVKILLNDPAQKVLGGRRLQFRIRDKIRGDSDWYTIKQTFVRIPQIMSVKCTRDLKEKCELKGQGINFIQQVSVDGGATWFPSEQVGLMTSPAENGLDKALIPNYSGHKKTLKIRLRDFSKIEGLEVSGYVFTRF